MLTGNERDGQTFIEGQDLDDWHDDRDKVWERQREAEVYKMTKEL